MADKRLDGVDVGDHDLVVTVEDGIIRGGNGYMIAEALDAAEVDTPVRRMGVANYFPRHALGSG